MWGSSKQPSDRMLPDLMAHFTWPQPDDEFPSAVFNMNSSGAVQPSGQSLAAEMQVSSATGLVLWPLPHSPPQFHYPSR